MNYTSETKKGTDGTVDIIAELVAKDFATFRGKAVAAVSEKVEVKGFRKGNIPEDVLVKHAGEAVILEEMAQLAITTLYPELIKKHNIDAIGRPQISITKLAPGNPLGFTVTTSVLPEVTLPDYAKIAGKVMKEKGDTEVTDKEIEDAVNHLRQMRAQHSHVGHDHGPDEACDHEHDEKAELPELDDEFVKTLGKFENVADFKNKLRENLKIEKEGRAVEKKRIDTLDQILEKTKVEVPAILTNYEIEKMMQQMEHDIAMSGLTFEDYLGKIEKTREDLKKDWHDTAEKRAKMHLVITAIAEKEKIEPSIDEIDAETKKVMEMYKDAEGIDENSVRLYVSGMITNQKVFEFLEKQSA